MKSVLFAFAALMAMPALIWAAPALAAGGAGGEAPALPASRLEVAITVYEPVVRRLVGVMIGRNSVVDVCHHAVRGDDPIPRCRSPIQAVEKMASENRVAGPRPAFIV